MQKNTIIVLLLGLILVALGGYYLFAHRTPDTLAVLPDSVSVATTTQVTTTAADDDPNLRYYEEPDAKLHIYKDMVLDPEIITINYELKDVTLCGKTYKTKQIIVDGVDVVQRLAQLLAMDSQKSDWYCKKLTANTRDTGGVLAGGEEIHLIIATTGINYSFAPHVGVEWKANFAPIYVHLEENKLVAHMDVYLGTLR